MVNKDDGIKYYNGDFQERHIAQPGDVLVANTEQGHDRLLIGFSAVVPNRFGAHGLFSHHLYRVQPKVTSGLSAEFVCQLLNTQAVHDTVSGYATGTTVNMLPVDALRIPEMILPPVEVVTGLHRCGGNHPFQRGNLKLKNPVPSPPSEMCCCLIPIHVERAVNPSFPLKMNRTSPHRRSREEPAPEKSGAGIHSLSTHIRRHHGDLV